MNRFKYRKIIPEIIDDFSWSGKELNQNLEEIEWINKNLGGTNTSACPVLFYIQKNLRKDLKIVDIGCGSGDLLKKIQLACERIKKIELVAENEAYAPIDITGDVELKIWGVVTNVIHHL